VNDRLGQVEAFRMFSGFADCCHSTLEAVFAIPDFNFNIPIIDDLICQDGGGNHPRLFVISGQSQAYKTTFAVKLLAPFLSTFFESSRAVWIDADLRFPVDFLKSSGFHLAKLDVVKCRSTEDVLFWLLAIEHQLLYGKSMEGLRCIVIDGINSSFWIDESARNFVKRPIRWTLKDLVEKFVVSYGLNVVVVFQDLGDFEIWPSLENAVTLKLRFILNGPGRGFVICGDNQDDFTVTDERQFQWGKRHIIRAERYA
jgi:hypothetical protein